jgi:hypothetical protein
MYEYIAKELLKDLSNAHSFISPEPILTKNSTSPVQQFVKDLTRISGNFKTSRHVIDIISIANYDTSGTCVENMRNLCIGRKQQKNTKEKRTEFEKIVADFNAGQAAPLVNVHPPPEEENVIDLNPHQRAMMIGLVEEWSEGEDEMQVVLALNEELLEDPTENWLNNDHVLEVDDSDNPIIEDFNEEVQIILQPDLEEVIMNADAADLGAVDGNRSQLKSIKKLNIFENFFAPKPKKMYQNTIDCTQWDNFMHHHPLGPRVDTNAKVRVHIVIDRFTNAAEAHETRIMEESLKEYVAIFKTTECYKLYQRENTRVIKIRNKVTGVITFKLYVPGFTLRMAFFTMCPCMSYEKPRSCANIPKEEAQFAIKSAHFYINSPAVVEDRRNCADNGCIPCSAGMSAQFFEATRSLTKFLNHCFCEQKLLPPQMIPDSRSAKCNRFKYLCGKFKAIYVTTAHKLKSISSILHQPTCFKGTHDGVCQKPKEEIKEGNFNLDHNFKLYTYMHILNTYLI